VQETLSDAAQPVLGELLDQIMRSYTMAREREVHRLYSAVLCDDSGDIALATTEDDDDGGLF
jgi:hypothetical protein